MRKFTSVLLALVLCAALLCIGAAAADTEDTIKIGTAEELAKIGNDSSYPLSGNYILTAKFSPPISTSAAVRKSRGSRLAATKTMPSPAPSTAMDTR